MVDASSPSGPARESTSLTHQGLSDLDPWLASHSRRASPSRLHALAEVLEVAALALLMFIAVRTVAQNFIVDGESMQPTFEHGQLLIVNKLAYDSFDLSWLPWSDEAWEPFGDPQPGDVVVFRFPFDPDRDFIKRIIAFPGRRWR